MTRHRVQAPLCLLLAAALPVAAQTRASRDDFALVRVSDGVYAAITFQF